MSTFNPISVKVLAEANNLDPAAIYAVAEVESGGKSGYAPGGNGLLLVLFEAHIFYQQLKRNGKNPKVLMSEYPGLISQTWNQKLYKGGLFENSRLAQAAKIDRIAAFRSASYGMFQIMGFNAEICGFKDVFEMISYLRQGPDNMLDVFFRFVKTSPAMLRALQLEDFTTFARLYNGPGYAQNHYDTKMLDAFNRHKQNPILV